MKESVVGSGPILMPGKSCSSKYLEKERKSLARWHKQEVRELPRITQLSTIIKNIEDQEYTTYKFEANLGYMRPSLQKQVKTTPNQKQISEVPLA